MTIDRFNKLTGHETLHPLICMVDLSKANLTEDIRMMCNFYGLLYYNDSCGNSEKSCTMPSTGIAQRSSPRISNCYSITVYAFAVSELQNRNNYPSNRNL